MSSNSLPTSTRVWIVANPPVAAIQKDTFKLETRQLDSANLPKDSVLLQTLYLSNDPAQRGWIDANADDKRLYVKPTRAGEVMPAGAIAKVLASTSDKLKVGQLVSSRTGWSEYAIVPAEGLSPVPADIDSPTLALGLLGSTGLTAWFGLHEVGHIKKEDTVVISGAAGATGSAAIQIAKNIVGCKKVIGIAGGKEKCELVKSLGADDCVDYKSSDFDKELTKVLGDDDADIYYDNVGGDVLNTMLPHVKRWGRVVACGSIAAYNDPSKQVLPNWMEIITNRLTVQGFIVFDFPSKIPEAKAGLTKALKEGKIKATGDHETVRDADFEHIPDVWQELFTGSNRGKLITKLKSA